MLEINNLHVNVDGREILKGLDLALSKGQVHAIMGPNGSGKSTLAYVLAGKEGYEVTEGSITWNGQDLLAMDPSERAAAGVFLAFQYPMEIPGVATMTFLRAAANAVRIVAEGVNALRGPDRAMLVITHYQRLLNYIVPDRVHVLSDGRVARSGGPELALELEQTGYAEFGEAAA